LTVIADQPFVARVAGRAITLEQLDRRIADLRRGPRGRHMPPDGGEVSVSVRRWVVQELVTEAVMRLEAERVGIIAPGRERDGGPDGRLTEPAVARLVETMTSDVTVSRRAIRSYYVRNGDRFRRPAARRVRHILCPDRESALEVIRRLAAGADMAALAGAMSTDVGTRTRGGDLGDVRRGELSGSFEDAIFAAPAGTVIGPVQTEHGWHVARVDAVSEPSCVPYAEARATIEADLLAAERSTVFGAWLEARRVALAVIEPGFEHPADPVHGFPSHRH
jgi:[acyl-carrier-protein] S-malonyltransferase